jgi:hypothetical protein
MVFQGGKFNNSFGLFDFCALLTSKNHPAIIVAVGKLFCRNKLYVSTSEIESA